MPWTYDSSGFQIWIPDDAPPAQASAPVPAAKRPVDPYSVQRVQAVNQIQQRMQGDSAFNEQLIQQLLGNQGRQQGAANFANMVDSNALSGLVGSQSNAMQGYQGVANNVRDSANTANAATGGLFGGLLQQYGGLNAFDQAVYGDYMNTTNPLMSMGSARASDPADIQRQMGAYNQAAGIAGGSLDYQAAQYASNPADVQRQMQAYNTLMGVGGGSLDYQAAQAQAVLAKVTHAQAVLAQTAKYASNPADLKAQIDSLEAIKRDLQSGGAEQKAAMEKFKSLSDPEVTAKERFLSEVARREFESADKSSRDAVSENLAMRGLRSGGQQIAMQQAARQQLSQDRLLKELGIQAGAVDRSMQALAGWGNMANAIRASDQTGLGLQSNQVNAIRDMNDRVGMFNTAEQNTTNRYNAGLQTQNNQFNAQQSNNIAMHNSAMQTQTNQFNAQQTNIARANNQATRLAGYQGAAAQSNAIRSANDQVGMFNTGQTNIARANNQTTRFNGAQLQAAQSNAIRSANDSQRQFEDTFRQNEAARVGNLATQRANTGFAASANVGQRVQGAYDAGRQGIQDIYGRDMDANQAQWDVTSKGYDMAGDYFDTVTGAADRKFTRESQLANTGALTGGTISGVRAQDTDALIRLLGIQNQASTDARERGLLGF